MSFYERALQHQKRRGGVLCKVGVLLSECSDEYADQVNATFADENIGPSPIWTLLKEDGHEIAMSSVSRHRLKQCACPAS